MRKQQWIEVVAVMVGLWPNFKPTQHQIDVAYPILAEFDYDDVLGAVYELSREGREFAPPVGVIAQKLDAEQEMPLLPFDQALRLIGSAAHGRSDREALMWLAERAPVVARWALEYGLRTLRMEPVDDPDKGNAVRVRLEKNYRSCAVTYQEERRKGIDRVGERLRLGGGSGQGDLRRPGMVAALTEGDSSGADQDDPA